MSCHWYDLGDELTIWICTGNMEERWVEHMCAQQAAEHELDADLRREEVLAQRHAYDELDCPWPWYADDPLILVKPQVFAGMSVK